MGQKAWAHGYRVLYRTSAELLADLTASLADKTLSARLRCYANPDLLIIDEFGFDRIERTECPEAAHLLHKIVASRNQKLFHRTGHQCGLRQMGRLSGRRSVGNCRPGQAGRRRHHLKVKGKSYRAPHIGNADTK